MDLKLTVPKRQSPELKCFPALEQHTHNIWNYTTNDQLGKTGKKTAFWFEEFKGDAL